MEPQRCNWCGDDPLYIAYHDHEWGVPLHDERRLFEMLILEGAQAGLSWLTVLRKRENYRRAFEDFDPQRIADWSAADVERLMGDPGIIRNRHPQCARHAGNRRAPWFAERVPVALCGSHARTEHMAPACGHSSQHARLQSHEQGSASPRLQLRRTDDLLCVHAGGRNGE
jgi:DNA-3-methyladenine glycosylase I